MLNFHTFDSSEAQAEALARAVGAALDQVLSTRPAPQRATLAVSGGKSPVAFCVHLSRLSIDWSRIDITLVDDRWVGDSDADSNARFVHEHLLQNAAAKARFLPLVDTSTSTEAVIDRLNGVSSADAASLLPALPDVAVLGMGEDGHTASIFADAPEWDDAITTSKRFLIVHPASAPHARISWSMHALKQVGVLFLQIGGEKKRVVLEAAIAQAQRNAISQLALDGGVTLNAYWFA
jgi:6-phosphogluconolactonase